MVVWLLDQIVTVKNHNVNDEKLLLDMVTFVVICLTLPNTRVVWFATVVGCWNQLRFSVIVPGYQQTAALVQAHRVQRIVYRFNKVSVIVDWATKWLARAALVRSPQLASPQVYHPRLHFLVINSKVADRKKRQSRNCN